MEEYNIRDIEAFQADYYKHGKYDLVAQAPHLAKLAAYYEKKYQHTQDWIDCVKVCCYHVLLPYFCCISACTYTCTIPMYSLST